jgi:predicted porin
MMKKILLGTVAVCGLAVAAATPAKADGLELGISGHFAGYGVFNDQDTPAGVDLRGFDLRKETEVHFIGETTLDNGLTVGVHIEALMDRADGNQTVEASYAYFSGDWGRVHLGEGAAATYLLQVAAPAADSNIDGIDPNINTFDLSRLVGANAGLTTDYLGYRQVQVTGYQNKITYVTPMFSGFQAGVSYTPSLSEGDQGNLAAITIDNNAGFDDALEVALRYEGTFDEIDLAIGGGYTTAGREVAVANGDDREAWNFGIDANWGPFGLGVAFTEDNNGFNNDSDTTFVVVGADYVTGPYTFGVSYLKREDEQNATSNPTAAELETTRWTAGVGYEYGPGMSFRGSIAMIEGESGVANDDEFDGYQISIGTQIDF